MSFHCYADDVQIYFSVKQSNSNTFGNLLACIQEVKDWLAANFFKLNEEKTEVIVFGPNSHLVSERLKDTPLAVAISEKVKSLGFILVSDLKMDKQINSVVKSSFFHLKLLAKTKPFFISNRF